MAADPARPYPRYKTNKHANIDFGLRSIMHSFHNERSYWIVALLVQLLGQKNIPLVGMRPE